MPLLQLTKLHIQIDINLMQNIPHVQRLRVRQHHKLNTRRRLIVMQLILSRSERYKAIIRTSQFPYHIPQREDCPEDELRIVLRAEAGRTSSCRSEVGNKCVASGCCARGRDGAIGGPRS